jgi:hypothetical protein
VDVLQVFAGDGRGEEDIDMESILKDKFLGTEVDSSKVPEI